MNPFEDQIYIIIFSTIFLGGLMSTFVVAMVFIHRQRQAQNRQKMDQIKSEHEKTLLNIENEIQQDTLSQVGRELHDNIGQLLSLAKLYLNSSKPEKQAEGKEYVNQIIQEVRTLSKTLNLDWVESITLEEFIQGQLDRIKAAGFCEVELQADGEFSNLEKDQKLILIRVIQECFNNAIKHASPSMLSVTLAKNDQVRTIRILDNGAGFDTQVQSSGSGMHNLKKRMETIGGKFLVHSSPGNGTEIQLQLPN